jgi:hypothetical protein
MSEEGKERTACLQIFKKILNEFNTGFDEQKDKRSLREQIGNDKNMESLSDNDKLKYKQHTKGEKKGPHKHKLSERRNRNQGKKKLIAACFDLQQVLLTPHSDSTLLCYSRKYGYYNLTIYKV